MSPSLANLIGWIVWGILTVLATAGLGIFVWAVIEKVRTPVYFANENAAGWLLRILLGLQVGLLWTITILFLTKDWSKLHLLWLAPICFFPILLMRVVADRFIRSLENERRFVEQLTGRPQDKGVQ